MIKVLNDYSKIVSEANYKAIYEEGLKILIPEQMLERLPIAIVQLKAGNTSENLLNEIRKIEITKKVYYIKQTKSLKKCIKKIMNAIYNTEMYTIFMNSKNSEISDLHRVLCYR